jgi:virginiamycin B lyase
MGKVQNASTMVEKDRAAMVIQSKKAEKRRTAIRSTRHQRRRWLMVSVVLVGVIIIITLTLSGLQLVAQTKGASSGRSLSTKITPKANVQTAQVRVYHVFPTDAGLMLPAIDGHGYVWFGEMATNLLARLDPRTGVVKTWTPPRGDDGIMANIIDGKGDVWFTEQNANYIGVFHPASQTFQTYSFGSNKKDRVGLQDLQFDASGKLWFSELTGRRIGQLDPTNSKIRTWAMPNSVGGAAAYPFGLTLVADGQVWFGAFAGGVVGHLNPATGQIKLYNLADPREQVYAMAADSVGRVWFTELQFGKLGMIDTKTGNVIEVYVPLILGNPEDLHSIVVARDGNIWFTSGGANALVRYSPEKTTFTFFQLTWPNSGLFGLAQDAASRLWFTAGGGQQANYVGVMTA